MLKHANRTTVPCAFVNTLPPGVMERTAALHQREVENAEINNLKDELRSSLAEATKAARKGWDLYALSLEHQAAVAMRSLIEKGVL